MYSRSFTEESKKMTPPANYDGCAFKEEEKEAKTFTRPPTNEEIPTEIPAFGEQQTLGKSGVNSPFSSVLGFGKNLFGGLFGSSLGLPKLGTEEILIIATALFLLFSKEGDKECAILLLLLLLIN